MAVLTKHQILACDDLKRVEVFIPEWGMSVFVRTMTAGERDQIEAEQAKDPNADFRARYCSAVLCDADGKSLFTRADVADLNRKSAAALDRVIQAAVRLNALSRADVDELEKNSGASPSAASPSGSP